MVEVTITVSVNIWLLSSAIYIFAMLQFLVKIYQQDEIACVAAS